MLLLLEGFDNLHPAYYSSIPGFLVDNYCYPYGGNASDWPFPVVSGSSLWLHNYGISEGYAAVMSPSGTYLRPGLFEKSRKLYVGFSLGCLNKAVSFSTDQYGSYFFHSGNSINESGKLFADHCAYLDVRFVTRLVSGNSVTNGYINENEFVSFIARIYLRNSNAIGVRFITGKGISNHRPSTSTLIGDYPIIPQSGLIPCDLSASNYFEFMVDSNGAINSTGCAEFRLNGKTVYRQDGIVTSAYKDYSSDTFSDASYFRAVSFFCPNIPSTYYNPDYLLDDLYILNDQGGTCDNFFGPIKVRQPDSVSCSSFEFSESNPDGVILPVSRVSYDDKFVDSPNSDFLFSDSMGAEDAGLLSTDLGLFEPVFCVSHRIVTFSNPNIPLVIPSSVDCIRSVISNSSSRQVSTSVSIPAPGNYSVCDNPYPFNPVESSAWTRDNFLSSLFGFVSSSASFSDLLLGKSPSSQTYTSPFSNLSNITDGNPDTFCEAYASSWSLTYSFDPNIDASFVDIFASSFSSLYFKAVMSGYELRIDAYSPVSSSVAGSYGRRFQIPRGAVSGIILYGYYSASIYSVSIPVAN